MTRASILSAAAACVTQDRNNTYGPPEDSFAVIASYWSVYLGVPVTPAGVGTLLALMKVARIQHNPAHADSYVDGAGYLACAGGIATAEPREMVALSHFAKLAAEQSAIPDPTWVTMQRVNARDSVSDERRQVRESTCADEEPLK